MTKPEAISPKRIGMAVAALVLAYLVAPVFMQHAPPPLVDNARILVRDIYQDVDSVARIPREIALPYIAQTGISQFIKVLPLQAEVRSRVTARLNTKDFVHELVPFLLAVKDMYVPDRGGVTTFDSHFRSTFGETDSIPGMQHSMFNWQDEGVVDEQPDVIDADENIEQPEKEEAGFGLTLELAAQLITFYDALYLRGNESAVSTGQRLSCDANNTAERLEKRTAQVQPALRQVLEEVLSSMSEESDITNALRATLNDAPRLETISLSVVEFVDLMVCKHYRMFAGRVMRQEQLHTWLSKELDSPQSGQLWNWINQTQQRKYGAVIAVDGLQGHLVETLATNNWQSAFAQTIAAHQTEGAKQATSPKLEQQVEFLNAFAEQGFSHQSYLPFFKDLYSDDGAGDSFSPNAIATSGISTTPTISVRNLPIIKTGAPVAGDGATGVPNFHFVDRNYSQNGVQQGRAYYFFGNDALKLTALTKSAGMRSLFERLPSHGSYNCTAQYDDYAHASVDPFLNLALGEKLRDFGEVICLAQLGERARNEVKLQQLRNELLALRDRLGIDTVWYNWYQRWNASTARTRAEQLIEQIAELEPDSFPQLLVYYNPWPDHFAHFTGPFADEVLSPSGELARLDFWLGQLTALYRQAGVFERTLFGMSGDHGLSPVFRLEDPMGKVFEPLRAQGIPIKIVKISSDEGEGPKLTHALNPPSMRDIDVVVASTAGGNLMLDLFADQTERWHLQPLEQDVRQWQPIAWQDETEGAKRSIDLIKNLVDGLSDSLEYLAVRTEPGKADGGAVALHSAAGTAHITRRGNLIHYRFERADPLKLASLSPYDTFTDQQKDAHKQLLDDCLGADEVTMNSWCTEAQWRELAAYTAKPDSVVQLAHLYDSDRAGTVNLFPADGIAYNSIVPGRHAGESFHEKDAFVGLWGEPTNTNLLDRPDRLTNALGGSVPAAIYEHLTGTKTTPGTDGWGYPSLWQHHSPND